MKKKAWYKEVRESLAWQSSPELSRIDIKGEGMTLLCSLYSGMSIPLSLHSGFTIWLLLEPGESPPSWPEAYLLIIRQIPHCEPAGGNKGGLI